MGVSNVGQNRNEDNMEYFQSLSELSSVKEWQHLLAAAVPAGGRCRSECPALDRLHNAG